MDLICPHIYIGCTILNEDVFVENNISKLSECLHFPDVLDTPETCFIDILLSTNEFLGKVVKNQKNDSNCTHGNVLIHCVYGQSRSAVVIWWYLITDMMSHRQRSPSSTVSSVEIMSVIRDAFEVLYNNHPCICINPGFISQLHLCAHSTYGALYYNEFSACFHQCLRIRPGGDNTTTSTIDSTPAVNMAPKSSKTVVMVDCRSCGQVLVKSVPTRDTVGPIVTGLGLRIAGSARDTVGPIVTGLGLRIAGSVVQTPLTGMVYDYERDTDPKTHSVYMDPPSGSAGAPAMKGTKAAKPVVASSGGAGTHIKNNVLGSVPYLHDFWRDYFPTQSQPVLPLPPTTDAPTGNGNGSGASSTVFKTGGKGKMKQKQKRVGGGIGTGITANDCRGVATVVILSKDSHCRVLDACSSGSSSVFIDCNSCGACCGVAVPQGLYICNRYVLVDCVAFYTEETVCRGAGSEAKHRR